MKITTAPCCKVGWEGKTLHYVVKAEGASEVLVPKDACKDGLEFTVTGTRQTADGVEADLQVRVTGNALY